jgi:hypothetical protein
LFRGEHPSCTSRAHSAASCGRKQTVSPLHAGTPCPPPWKRVWALRDPSSMLHQSVACSENGIGTRRVAKAAGG